MSQFNGSLGWIAIAAEGSSTYGTAGSPLVYQHGISSSMGLRETRAVPPTLGSNAPNTGIRLAKYADGQVVLGMSRSRAIIGNIYAHMASLATNDYSFTGTPGVNSLSVFQDYGGVEYDTLGGIIRAITWELAGGGDFSRISLDMVGQDFVKYTSTARTPSLPADSALIIPSGLTTFTIGGTAVGSLKSATITVERSVSGVERQRMGSAVMPQPVIGAERPVIRGTFNVELASASGLNVVSELDKFLAGNTMATIACSDFSLTGCQPIGEIPSLQRGFIEVSLQVEATGLTVTTAA